MAAVQRGKPSSRSFATVTIQSGDTAGASEIISLTGLTLSCIQTSSFGWDAASLGFNGNANGSTEMFPVYNTAGDHLTFTTSASRLLVFDPAQFAGLQKIQLVSKTTAGVAVQQSGGDRIMVLGLSEYVQAD